MNRTAFDIIRANTRLPEVLIGDLSAHMAACFTEEERFRDLLKEYGWETLDRYFDALLEYAE